jgi:non-heme chloroperoxidase
MKRKILSFLALSLPVLAGHAQVPEDAAVSSRSNRESFEEHPTNFVTSSDGTLIAVHESGPLQGKPLVFVHGWSASSAVWVQQQLSPLLRQYHIVAMDLRGHGYSGKPIDPRAYAVRTLFADDVNAVIQQLHLHRPALIGWSLGGGVIMDYLQKYGESFISGVDLADSLASPNATIAGLAAMLLAADPFIPPLVSNDAPTNFAGIVAYVNLFASGSPTSSGPLTPGEESTFQDILLTTPVFVRRNYVNGVGAAITTDFGALLASLTVPVLLQGARNDAIFPQVKVITAEAAVIKNHTVKFYEIGGHIPFFLFPEPFNRDLAEWLETLRF